jgi:aspartyl-tRNA(Asn)/glutamyl-tRNA(Gln) amidotransferase subunit A
MSDDLNWMSAAKLARGFAKRKFSSLDVAKACLAQIAKHDGEVNAICHLDQELTLTQAAQSQARWHKGKPLSAIDGVPVLIKDLLLVKGWPTRRGSRTVDTAQTWDHDAPAVARLREAGAVFLGLTTTPEYGWKGVTDSPLTGITRNPWDLSKTPGGSSGGSSAALIAGYAPLTLGTDGGGSIRIPAAFTGTFGLKPSFGRVPAWPLSPFGTVAHVGPMTRTVRDAALLMNEISKPDPRDWHGLPYDPRDYTRKLEGGLKGMKIAFSATLGYATVDPEVAKLVKAAVKILRGLGAKVKLVDPGFPDPADMFRVLWWSGAKAALGHLTDEKKALLDPQLAAVVAAAGDITLAHYQEATRLRGALGSQMRAFMMDYDALVTPTMPGTAFEAGKLSPIDMGTGQWVNWTPFSYPFNLTQQPAASVPCGFTRAGLPAGLHVVGRMFDDKTVLRICAAYEAETGFGKRRPAGF